MDEETSIFIKKYNQILKFKSQAKKILKKLKDTILIHIIQI